eukprot:3907-Heterococcus_DN1.PRE.1
MGIIVQQCKKVSLTRLEELSSREAVCLVISNAHLSIDPSQPYLGLNFGGYKAQSARRNSLRSQSWLCGNSARYGAAAHADHSAT